MLTNFSSRALLVIVCVASCFGAETTAQDVAETKTYAIPDDESLPGVGPMRRYEWFRSLWRRRRTMFADSQARSSGAVVFLGDSITQGWGEDFRGAFPGVKKANRGISGDTTRGMLFRLEEDVLRLNPLAVVMLMGTNDLEEKAEPETIVANIRSILAALKKHDASMPIVLCEVFPSSATKARPANKIKEINRLCRNAIRGDAQVTVLDTWTLFADSKGDAVKEEFPDLLHPNGLGYKKWEAAMTPIFATLGLMETEPEPFEREPETQSLFNGKDLTGWGYRRTPDGMRKSRERWMSRKPEGVVWPLVDEPLDLGGQTNSPDGRYAVIGGRLVVTTPPEGRKIQQLWTTKDFGKDFRFKLEFRATPMADSGIFIRGKQLQCRDFPLAGPYKDLSSFNSFGWNEMEITVRGTTARCTCNGEVIEEAMAVPESGPIGLEGDRGQVEYRRLRIEEL
ncbi:MAG: GDSL-type esterase/lipase family protein [Planctomycetota bacterium]